MSRDVQRCPEMSRDVQRCPEMSRDVQRFIRAWHSARLHPMTRTWQPHKQNSSSATTRQLYPATTEQEHDKYNKMTFSGVPSIPWLDSTSNATNCCQLLHRLIIVWPKAPSRSSVYWIWVPWINPFHTTLWLCQNSYWKSPFLMGKSTINGPCSIAMLVYQRVFHNIIQYLPPESGKRIWTRKPAASWMTAQTKPWGLAVANVTSGAPDLIFVQMFNMIEQ